MSMGSSQKAGRSAKDRGNKPHTVQTQSTKVAADGCKAMTQDGPIPKVQPTADQIRIAQIINDSNKTDPDLQKKIEQIMELTGKTSDAAIVALYDCDNDPVKAIDMLLDGDQNEGEWETRGKKKKKSQNPTVLQKSPEAVISDSVNNNNNNNNMIISNKEDRSRGEPDGRDEHRNREGSSNRGPPRLNRVGKSWRSKEHEKNERNLEDGYRDRSTEGRFRGGRRVRGRGGSRSRTFQNRGLLTDGFPQSIDTWTNSTAEQGSIQVRTEATMTVGNWHEVHTTASEDWSEEDWNGSLTETKVFTPSVSTSAINEIDSSHLSQSLDLASLLRKSSSSPDATTQNLLPSVASQLQSCISGLPQSTLHPEDSMQQSQNQFSLSQYAQQATETIKAAVGQMTSSLINNSSSHGTTTPSLHYTSGFATNSVASTSALPVSDTEQSISSVTLTVTDDTQTSSVVSQASVLPARTKSSKTRVPPPSKIPESAVEMPDGAIVSLDVQFGALEFGSDALFEMLPATESSVYDSPNSSTSASVTSHNMPSKTTVGSPSNGPSSSSLSSTNSLSRESFHLGSHSQGVGTCISGQSPSNDSGHCAPINQNALGPSSKIPSPDSILLPSQGERKGSIGITSYNNQRPPQSAALDGPAIAKQDSANLSSFSGSSHQSNHSGHSDSYSTPYSAQKSCVLSSSTLTPSANSFSHSNSSLPTLNSQPGLGSGNPSQTPYVSSQSQTSSFPPPSTTYIQQSMYSGTSVAPAVTSYSSQPGFSSQSSSSYSSGISTYSSQQCYGTPTSVTTQSANPTRHSSSIQSTKLASSLSHSVKDTVLENQQAASQHTYDSSHTSTAGSGLSATNSSSTAGLSGTNIGVTSSLVLAASASSSTATTSVLKNSLSTSTSRSSGKTMANIPPGVPAATAMLGHQYIMGQSLPFYGLQQTLYSYEDLQMLQSRLQPLGYYDMQFQAPTSLTGRDPGLGSIAYTGTDGKFSRADNDAAAVVTTLSQGQPTAQAHSQPYLNPAATLPPGYGYYFPGGMMPGSIHHYGPPIFPVTPATNAHGASTSSQFQKPAAYGSHSYGSAYDTLTQAQDFTKGTYGTSSQGQVKGVSGTAGAGTDISGSMYSKSHAQLAKVQRLAW